MSEVVEAPASVLSQTLPTRQRTPSPTAPRGAPELKSRLWKSTLPAADLDRLLSVLEVQLIPQLLACYSPARQSPLASDS